MLYARLLAGIGEVEQAVAQYRRGVAQDASAADPEFATRLGIRVEPEREREQESEADEEAPDAPEDESLQSFFNQFK